MRLTDLISLSISIDKKRLEHYEHLAASSVDGRLNCRYDKRRNTLSYYYKSDKEKTEHRLRKEPNAHIWKLQRKRFGKEMVRTLLHNLNVKQQCLESLLPDSEDDILSSMPRAYRPDPDFCPKGNASSASHKKHGIHKDYPTQNTPQSKNPSHREELKIRTSFGLYVRTKGELIIAELLYSLGIEFLYEHPLRLTVQRKEEDTGIIYWTEITYHPDFTLLLPFGFRYYWEHKGMLSKRGYTERDIQRTIDYNMNGIYQSHNLIVTEEGPDNDLDFDGIKQIAMSLLK